MSDTLFLVSSTASLGLTRNVLKTFRPYFSKDTSATIGEIFLRSRVFKIQKNLLHEFQSNSIASAALLQEASRGHLAEG